MSLVIDEEMYRSFVKDGVNDDTSRAFGHLFAYFQGRCELENYLREKFEKIGLLDPDDETIKMEDVDSSLEWILLTACFEGKIERGWNEKKKCYQYKNTEFGNAEAIKMIKKMAKKDV